MNFLADESVDRPIVERLRQEGHQVSYIAELGPGMSDDAVLNLANQQTALLLTADKDFGEMVFRQRLHTHGVVRHFTDSSGRRDTRPQSGDCGFGS
jgi:predicted nuclease of predicted toxin-antitoxin system